jgi:hypothetical protein
MLPSLILLLGMSTATTAIYVGTIPSNWEYIGCLSDPGVNARALNETCELWQNECQVSR